MDTNGQGGNLCKTDQSEEQPSELSGQHVEECEKQKTRKDTRKANKPLMEKRRRERINNSLEQLKTMLMDQTKHQSSYYSKLEKADVLEMTVNYMHNLKQQQQQQQQQQQKHKQQPLTAPAVLIYQDDATNTYSTGFNECTQEVSKYLNQMRVLSDDAKRHLFSHLAECTNDKSGGVDGTLQNVLSHSTSVTNPHQIMYPQSQQDIAQPLSENSSTCVTNFNPLIHPDSTNNTDFDNKQTHSFQVESNLISLSPNISNQREYHGDGDSTSFTDRTSDILKPLCAHVQHFQKPTVTDHSDVGVCIVQQQVQSHMQILPAILPSGQTIYVLATPAKSVQVDTDCINDLGANATITYKNTQSTIHPGHTSTINNTHQLENTIKRKPEAALGSPDQTGETSNLMLTKTKPLATWFSNRLQNIECEENTEQYGTYNNNPLQVETSIGQVNSIPISYLNTSKYNTDYSSIYSASGDNSSYSRNEPMLEINPTKPKSPYSLYVSVNTDNKSLDDVFNATLTSPDSAYTSGTSEKKSNVSSDFSSTSSVSLLSDEPSTYIPHRLSSTTSLDMVSYKSVFHSPKTKVFQFPCSSHSKTSGVDIANTNLSQYYPSHDINFSLTSDEPLTKPLLPNSQPIKHAGSVAGYSLHLDEHTDKSNDCQTSQNIVQLPPSSGEQDHASGLGTSHVDPMWRPW